MLLEELSELADGETGARPCGHLRARSAMNYN